MGQETAMKKTIRVVCNVFIAAIVIWTWLKMALRSGGGRLTARSFSSLRNFTTLSNLLEALAALVWLACQGPGKAKKSAETLKYAAAVSVGLTLLIVIVFLGPMFGYRGMFDGSNLWFHLLVPLLAMAEFILLGDRPMDRRENILALAPMLLYGVYYVGCAAVNGISAGRRSGDWYGFFTWGWGPGIGVCAAIIGLTFLIGLALRKANDQFLRR